jgi:hypothetical protein
MSRSIGQEIIASAMQLGELWSWDWDQIDAHLESEFGADYDDMAVLCDLQDQGHCLDVSPGRFQLETVQPA